MPLHTTEEGEEVVRLRAEVKSLAHERACLIAEVERLQERIAAMDWPEDVAARQREACAADAVKGKYALTGGPNSLSGAFNSGVDDAEKRVRATPLVTGGGK